MLVSIAQNTVLDTDTFKVWYSDTGTYLGYADIVEILEKNSKWFVPTLEDFYEIFSKIANSDKEDFLNLEKELKFADATGFITAHQQKFIYNANFVNNHSIQNCDLHDKYRLLLWRHLEENELPTIIVQKEKFEFF